MINKKYCRRLFDPFLFALLMLAVAPAAAQQSPATAQQDNQPASPSDTAEVSGAETEAVPNEGDETEILRVVVRVSWKLIDALADDQIQADIPFESNVMDGRMWGRVASRADLTIEIEDRDDEALFSITAEGTARGRFGAAKGVFCINGPITIPFTAKKQVRFDGRNFAGGDVSVDARVDAPFQSIRTRRNGPIGRIVGRIATPAIRSRNCEAERAAAPVAAEYLEKFVQDETAVITQRLNEITPIEASILRVYPQLKDWRIKLASDKDHLEARYGPPDSEDIVLPLEAKRPQRAGLEIWIRTTEAEAKFLERLGGWQKSQELLKQYLAAAEATGISADTKIVAVDDWAVISLGKFDPSGEN